MNSIRILLSPDVDAKTIKNLHRFHTVSISNSVRSGFLATDTENEIRQLLNVLGVWHINAAYPLNLIGKTAGELLAWRLEEPTYPKEYDFICTFWATTPREKIEQAMMTLISKRWVSEIKSI